MTATVLAVSTAAVLDATAAHGVDPEDVAAAAGISTDVLRTPSARIDSARAAALWQIAFERTGAPTLALDAARRPRFGAYRLLDFLAATAPTVGDAFEHIAAHFAMINRAVTISFEREARGVWMSLSAQPPVTPAYLEYTLAAFYLRIRSATTVFSAAALDLVTPPERGHRDGCADVFGCEPRFGRGRSALLVSHDAWHAANPGADDALFAALDAHASQVVRDAATSYVDEVRAAIRELLPRGVPSLAATARRLATSTRVLQRRLAGDGIRYRDVLDAARFDEARILLSDRRLSVEEVAERLGFAQPSSFTRAFRRWARRPPSEFRSVNRRNPR